MRARAVEGDSPWGWLRVQAYLQGGAHDDQQVRSGEILRVEEILLREVFSKKHHVRFDRGGAERADGHSIAHDGRLRGREQGEEHRCGSTSVSRVGVTFASAAGYVV